MHLQGRIAFTFDAKHQEAEKIGLLFTLFGVAINLL
jgi:hypothetical protein